jgi:hypothetical protein
MMALVSMVPEWAEGTEELLAACRRTGRAVFVAGADGDADGGRRGGRGGGDRGGDNGGSRRGGSGFGFPVVPGGRRLGATVRELQAERGGVLLVSRRRAALTRADCGVGLAGGDGTPALGAHILVGKILRPWLSWSKRCRR